VTGVWPPLEELMKKAMKPNPGSNEAIALGCTCPVMDNGHGQGFPWPGTEGPSFWVNADCPVHGGRSDEG
jgi:hypothetical protein